MDSMYSKVEYMPRSEGFSCGYCSGSNCSYSTGMWAHALLVRDYQELIDRGWRRSGEYCYKPKCAITCCPLYTIRCEALNLKLSKSQKKILKKASKFFKEGNMDVKMNKAEEYSDETPSGTDTPMIDQVLFAQPESSDLTVNTSACRTGDIVPPSNDSNQRPTSAGQKKSPRKGDGIDLLKPHCKKAKLVRQEKKKNKVSGNQTESKGKTLEDLVKESTGENYVNKLELRLVRCSPQSVEFTETFETSYNLYRKYQLTIHKDPPSKCSKEQFKRFLVHSPLKAEYDVEGIPQGYGSFHHQYWLNDNLIAVGVIDVLPKCISSVYFFYDPDYSFLSLGSYSSLREIALVRELNKANAELEYYYMGFYIHSCPKMRYKARFAPSYLLCPETYSWRPVEESLPKLDRSKYARLNDDPRAEDENSKIILGDVLILWRNTAMSQELYKHTSRANDDGLILDYAKKVGRRAAESMLLYRP